MFNVGGKLSKCVILLLIQYNISNVGGKLYICVI